ncbi:monoglyceride lipase [Salpingoeca rosetta]|uniref:Monoglyceride lipase n=1 Tax=Salpingoeca rosetta (strain ATCC 50818 / BSB-021) TaxID=946362 RepID=F2U6Y0_SALR5|nr:monoglyceride lipase [Salpingoeca rosetta]EGD83612.1 monoglyceride lipase [Salpingoeca rosetta]|eukprot:XP_004995116.1 monoglyceride lipase [Salpingoeca rosetta]
MPVRRQSTVRAKRTWNIRLENGGKVLVNEDGQRLHRHVWDACSAEPKGIVFFLHGGMEHCRRYDSTAERLNAANYKVVAHDYVGHGRSDGERNVIHDFDVYVRDVVAEVRELRRVHPNLPIFLAGISLGGLIACLVNTQVRVDGMVLVAPAVKPDPRTATKGRVRMAKMLNKVAPRLGVTRLELDWISRNKDEVEDYKADPLVYHGKMRACFAMAVLAACEDLEKRVDKITAPLLVLHGEDDKITSMVASRFLVDNAGSKDKKLVTFPEHRHNLLHELPEASEKIHTMIVEWLDKHVDPSAAPSSAAEAQVASEKKTSDAEGPPSPPPSMATSTAGPSASGPTKEDIEQTLEPLAEGGEEEAEPSKEAEAETAAEIEKESEEKSTEDNDAESAKPEDPRSPPPSMATSTAVGKKDSEEAEEKKGEEEKQEEAGEKKGEDKEGEAVVAGGDDDGALKPEDPRSPPPSMATSQAVDAKKGDKAEGEEEEKQDTAEAAEAKPMPVLTV